jgi:hypothetical protein
MKRWRASCGGRQRRRRADRAPSRCFRRNCLNRGSSGSPLAVRVPARASRRQPKPHPDGWGSDGTERPRPPPGSSPPRRRRPRPTPPSRALRPAARRPWKPPMLRSHRCPLRALHLVHRRRRGWRCRSRPPRQRPPRRARDGKPRPLSRPLPPRHRPPEPAAPWRSAPVPRSARRRRSLRIPRCRRQHWAATSLSAPLCRRCRTCSPPSLLTDASQRPPPRRPNTAKLPAYRCPRPPRLRPRGRPRGRQSTPPSHRKPSHQPLRMRRNGRQQPRPSPRLLRHRARSGRPRAAPMPWDTPRPHQSAGRPHRHASRP